MVEITLFGQIIMAIVICSLYWKINFYFERKEIFRFYQEKKVDNRYKNNTIVENISLISLL
jgi:hypothetical protein